MLSLGVTPEEILLRGRGIGRRPASGGRQMSCHWGNAALNVVTQSSPTGSQCLPAVGCAEASRYISRRQLPGCVAYGDELTYVSLGEGATSEGEFWESLNTACSLHLPVLYLVADNGFAISVPSADQSPAPISELVRGFRGLQVHRLDGRDYFEVRVSGRRHRRRGTGGSWPGPHPCDRHPAVLALLAGHPEQVPLAGRAGGRGRSRPARGDGTGLVEGGVLTADDVETSRRTPARSVLAAARRALAAARPGSGRHPRPRGRPPVCRPRRRGRRRRLGRGRRPR